MRNDMKKGSPGPKYIHIFLALGQFQRELDDPELISRNSFLYKGQSLTIREEGVRLRIKMGKGSKTDYNQTRHVCLVCQEHF